MMNGNLLIDKNQSRILFEHVITYAESGFSIIPIMESGGQKKYSNSWTGSLVLRITTFLSIKTIWAAMPVNAYFEATNTEGLSKRLPTI